MRFLNCFFVLPRGCSTFISSPSICASSCGCDDVVIRRRRTEATSVFRMHHVVRERRTEAICVFRMHHVHAQTEEDRVDIMYTPHRPAVDPDQGSAA